MRSALLLSLFSYCSVPANGDSPHNYALPTSHKYTDHKSQSIDDSPHITRKSIRISGGSEDEMEVLLKSLWKSSALTSEQYNTLHQFFNTCNKKSFNEDYHKSKLNRGWTTILDQHEEKTNLLNSYIKELKQINHNWEMRNKNLSILLLNSKMENRDLVINFKAKIKNYQDKIMHSDTCKMELEKMTKKNEHFKTKTEHLSKTIMEKDEHIQQLRKTLHEKDELITTLRNTISEKDGIILAHKNSAWTPKDPIPKGIQSILDGLRNRIREYEEETLFTALHRHSPISADVFQQFLSQQPKSFRKEVCKRPKQSLSEHDNFAEPGLHLITWTEQLIGDLINGRRIIELIANKGAYWQWKSKTSKAFQWSKLTGWAGEMGWNIDQLPNTLETYRKTILSTKHITSNSKNEVYIKSHLTKTNKPKTDKGLYLPKTGQKNIGEKISSYVRTTSSIKDSRQIPSRMNGVKTPSRRHYGKYSDEDGHRSVPHNFQSSRTTPWSEYGLRTIPSGKIDPEKSHDDKTITSNRYLGKINPKNSRNDPYLDILNSNIPESQSSSTKTRLFDSILSVSTLVHHKFSSNQANTVNCQALVPPLLEVVALHGRSSNTKHFFTREQLLEDEFGPTLCFLTEIFTQVFESTFASISKDEKSFQE